MMTSVADSTCIKSLSTIREAIASTILDHPELKDELLADPAKFLAEFFQAPVQKLCPSWPSRWLMNR